MVFYIIIKKNETASNIRFLVELFKDIYLTGISRIVTIILFFLTGTYFEPIYKLFSPSYDWIFWAGNFVLLVFGLLTIKNRFSSKSRTQVNQILLFLSNILTYKIIILIGICAIDNIVRFSAPRLTQIKT